MNKDLEAQLKGLLRAVAPREEFTHQLIATVGAKAAADANRFRPRPVSRRWWFSGLAASLVVAVGLGEHWRAQRELASGLEARRQVLQALHMTSQKLDLAYEAVKNQSSSLVDAPSGA